MGRSHLGNSSIYHKLRCQNLKQQPRSSLRRPVLDLLNHHGLTLPPVELSYFDFGEHVSDTELEPKSIRARKSYRLLQRDRNFLLDLKQLWQVKLEQLQLEHHRLEQMSTYTPLDLRNARPVFGKTTIDATSFSVQPQEQEQEQQQALQEWYHQKQQHEELQCQQITRQEQWSLSEAEQLHSSQHSEKDSYDYDFDVGSLSSWSDRELTCQSSDYITADDMYTDDDDSLFDAIILPTLHSGTGPPTPVATSSQQEVWNTIPQAKYPPQKDNCDSDDYFDATQDESNSYSP